MAPTAGPLQKFAEMDDAGKREYWAVLALKHCRGLGPRLRTRLLRNYGSALAAIEDLPHWLSLRIPDACLREFSREEWRKNAKKEWDAASRTNCLILTWGHELFPRQLRELRDAPALLYCSGDIKLLDSAIVGIVGSRQPGERNLRVARSLARSLSQSGITVVSGMAGGIDREAHLGSLEGVGKSIGVLGTGIEKEYPAQNRDLYEAMRSNGLLLSEFAPGSPPNPRNFPVRNRIISGLSLGVVVVEAAARSGSLITVRCALEQNREVFAVPGLALDDRSAGCQKLLRDGAHPVFGVEDILNNLRSELGMFQPVRRPDTDCVSPSLLESKSDIPGEPVEEGMAGVGFSGSDVAGKIAEGDNSLKLRAILNTNGPMHIDMIAQSLDVSSEQINPLLVCMEMLGEIRRLPGARYEAIS